MKKRWYLPILVLMFVFLQCLGIGYPQTVSAATKPNLLINGSAEEGMKGWNDPQDAWGNNISYTEHAAPDGKVFFWPCRKGVGSTYIYQDVKISNFSAGSYLQLTGQMANYDQSPHDQGTMILQYRDASGKVLSSDKAVQRNPNWIKQIITLPIPSGAVTARVILQADRFVGSDNDAYFDDIVLSPLSGTINKVYITGSKSKGAPGDKIQLSATDGVYKNASDYTWYSSYDQIATVDKNGLVTFASNMNSSLIGKEVIIYAKSKRTGIVGHYYFNSTTPNDKPANTNTTKVAAITGFRISKVTLEWSKEKNATGYKVYEYIGNKAKLIKTLKGHKKLKYTYSVPNDNKTRSYQTYSYKGNSKKKIRTRMTSVTFAWKKQSKATGYRVYTYDSKTKKYKLLKTISNVNTTSYTASKLKANSTYKFKVCAYKKVSGKIVQSKFTPIATIQTG